MKDFNTEGYTYQIETVADILKEIKPLLKDHWEEVSNNKSTLTFNPDWEVYQFLEKDGKLRIYTCRYKKKLIGYFVVMASNSLHSKEVIISYNDIFFVKKEYRSKNIGSNLIDFASENLRSLGVSILQINTKVTNPFDSILENLNFTLIERAYNKNL